MRLPPAVALLLALACLAAGCGKQDDSTPVACLEGADAYVGALAAAPGEVRLDGETPISECLAENQQAGDLATVGEALVEAATELNARGPGRPRRRRQPPARLPARRRPARGREHRRHPRRPAPPPYRRRPLRPRPRAAPPAFLAAYREGFDAGHADG